MTLSDLVAQLPAHIVLDHGLNADEVRDRLAAIGADDPERGHCIADSLRWATTRSLWIISTRTWLAR